jgi:post-segregation antitoxin (ccd killing protein)
MSIVIYADGRRMSHTSIVIPTELRDEARRQKISLSSVMEEALKARLAGVMNG